MTELLSEMVEVFSKCCKLIEKHDLSQLFDVSSFIQLGRLAKRVTIPRTLTLEIIKRIFTVYVFESNPQGIDHRF